MPKMCVNVCVLLLPFAAATIMPPLRSNALNIVWVDALTLGVGGRPFPSNSGNLTYARWPAAAQPALNPGEWSYGLHSAGMFVEFKSNATAIHVNYTLGNSQTSSFANFAPIGMSGVDLYAWDTASSEWRWVASAFEGLSRVGSNGVVLESPLFSNASGWPVGPAPSEPSFAGTTSYRLHFPSYNSVLAMAIGVPSGASLEGESDWDAVPPVVFLGTSITQGGVTPRPGTTYVHRLSMSLNHAVTNMGFCGSCRLELGLAKSLVSMPRVPKALVVDCTANMDTFTVQQNTVPFVKAVRAAWGPALPIVLVEPIDDTPSWFFGDALYQRGALRAALRAAYNELVADGDTALTYVPAGALRPGADDTAFEEELTYEGVHPLDRGHAIYAEALHGVLQPLLEGRSRGGVVAAPAGGVASAPATPAAAAVVQRARDAALKRRGGDAQPRRHKRALPRSQNETWVDALNLTVVGRAFPPEELPFPYARLPNAAKGVVRDAVWGLSTQSAGVAVAFSTDAPEVWIRYAVQDAMLPMVHFSVTGVSGADLFAFDEAAGRYRFIAPSQPTIGAKELVQQFTRPGFNASARGVTRYLLFLATYNSVVSAAVGVPPGWAVAPSVAFAPPNGGSPPAPIVWYGTSILQGGVSAKVGSIETARVSLALHREVFNYGFSGNCEMETAVAKFMLQGVPKPAALIIDCMWNMNGAGIQTAAVALVQYLRQNGLADTPVFLAEGLPFGRNWAVPASAAKQAQDNAFLAAAFSTLVAGGDAHLYYVNTSSLFGADAVLDSGTAAGLHASDRGMHDMSVLWAKLLTQVLGA